MKRGKFYEQYRSKRRLLITISALAVGFFYAFKNVSFLIRSIATVGIFLSFYLTDYFFKIGFKKRHYAFIIIIALSSFMFSSLYYIYPPYDKIQHFILPIMLASIIFHMTSKLKLALKWRLTFVFFIIIGSIGLFEVGEYSLDYFFGYTFQGVYLHDLQDLGRYDILLDRIDDTMIDMMLGILGTAVYWTFVGIRLRKKKSTPRN